MDKVTNTAKLIHCDKCGKDFKVGDWPWCPHDSRENHNYGFSLKGDGWTPKNE